jgi:transcriptional regulator with XRE-family HTH domain
MNIAKEIKQYCKENKLTQTQFGQLIDMKQANLSRLLSGKHKISVQIHNNIMKVLNKETDIKNNGNIQIITNNSESLYQEYINLYKDYNYTPSHDGYLTICELVNILCEIIQKNKKKSL